MPAGRPDQREPPADPADRVAAATLAVPGVASLHTGTFGEVATYLPGRRVTGVRIGEQEAEVHVVLHWGVPVLATAEAIRRAVEPLVGTPVTVQVDDVIDPGAGRQGCRSEDIRNEDVGP